MKEGVSQMASHAQPTILIVDDNVTSLSLGKEILAGSYRIYTVTTAETMFDLLEHIIPDLILLDVEMPVMNGYEAAKILKETTRLQDIPIIFLTSHSDEGSEFEGLSLGAIDYIRKPFSAPLLMKRIENHLNSEAQKKELIRYKTDLELDLKEEKNKTLSLQYSIIETVSDLVEFRDVNTGGHITRTQKYLSILYDELISEGIYKEEMKDWEPDTLIPSAQLHDVGKIAISDAILNKPGKLTNKEFEIMKTHVEIGLNTIKQIEKTTGEHRILRHAKLMVGGHHERWDGMGYPHGVSGADIPLEGRLMAIADVYDALVSSRPYKRPMTTKDARQIIESGEGTQFDPTLVRVFSNVADEFSAVVRNLMY